MKILCLDLSTHAGFAVFEWDRPSLPSLSNYGTIHLGKNVHSFGLYPESYRLCALAQIDNIVKLLDLHQPQLVLVEETNGGRNRYTQKILEWLHYRLCEVVRERDLSIAYIDSSAWRHNLGLVMTKEQKKANAKLRKAMREASSRGTKVDKKKLGIKGLVTPKHVAIAYVNEKLNLGLKVKDNDTADAICLGLAYFNDVSICDGA